MSSGRIIADRNSQSGRVALRLGGLVAVLLIGACGFHLRGALTLPPELERTYLDVALPGSGLSREVAQMLRQAGTTRMESAAEATARLTLSAEESRRTVLNVDSGGKANEYLLTTSFTFALSDSDGHSLIDEQRLTVERAVSYDSHQVLGSERQQTVLRREMRRFAVRQMFNRIRIALKPGRDGGSDR